MLSFPAAAPFARGRPWYWQSAPGGPTLDVSLSATHAAQPWVRLGASVLLLALLGGMGLLLRARGARAWPEQLLLLGAVGFLMLGTFPGSVFFAALALGWLAVRLTLLVRWRLPNARLKSA